jgi:hypothetical protein
LALGAVGVIWRAGVSERPETRGRGWERIAAVDVDVGVDQWRECPQVVLGCAVTSSSEFLHGLVEMAGVPQHDCVEDETEGSELVLLAFPVSLTELAPLTVEDLACESMARLLHRELARRHASCFGPPSGILHLACVLGSADRTWGRRDAAGGVDGRAGRVVVADGHGSVGCDRQVLDFAPRLLLDVEVLRARGSVPA